MKIKVTSKNKIYSSIINEEYEVIFDAGENYIIKAKSDRFTGVCLFMPKDDCEVVK